MKPTLFLSLILACGAAMAAAPQTTAPAAAAAPSSTVSPAAAPAVPPAPVASAPADSGAAPAPAAPEKVSPVVAAPGVVTGVTPVTMPPAGSSVGAGSMVQTILALFFVLALLVGLAWFMKRYGPKINHSNAAIRLVGSLGLGGRERVIVVEVADQWIVLGASPGRVNALATMPRQEHEPNVMLHHHNGPAAANFSEWLKQTLEKRNGK